MAGPELCRCYGTTRIEGFRSRRLYLGDPISELWGRDDTTRESRYNLRVMRVHSHNSRKRTLVHQNSTVRLALPNPTRLCCVGSSPSQSPSRRRLLLSRCSCGRHCRPHRRRRHHVAHLAAVTALATVTAFLAAAACDAVRTYRPRPPGATLQTGRTPPRPLPGSRAHARRVHCVR